MIDRELLLLAAKAFWNDEAEDVTFSYDDESGCICYIHADNQDHNGIDCELLWNSLESDYDALRLAVKLFLKIEHHEGSVVVWDDYCGTGYVPYEGDPVAATRRAITMAAADHAAAIGRSESQAAGGVA